MQASSLGVLVVALALSTAPGAFSLPVPSEPPSSEDPTVLGCGNLSPAANTCSDGPAELQHDPLPSVAVLGFEGRIWLRLVAIEKEGYAVWACDAILASPTVTCAEIAERRLERGDDVRLYCWTTSHSLLLGAVPPAGPWGCSVEV